MFNTSNGYSLSDIAAVSGGNRGNGDGFGDNGWWIILLFLFTGWGRNGWGGNGGSEGGYILNPYLYGANFGSAPCATKDDVRAAVDQQTLISKLDNQTYGLADSTYALSNAITTGFHGVDNAICTLGYQNQAGFNALATQIAQCCCDTRSAIADVKYANERNTCDIIRAGQDNTRAILDYLTGEKISSLQAENAGLKAQISNDRQSAYIVSQLKEPCPVPAYLTCDPRLPYNYGQNSCGCGCN